MPNPNDPLIVKMLEERAKKNAYYDHEKQHWVTGRAMEGDVVVLHYAGCGRKGHGKYAWYSNSEGLISKQRAVDILTKALWNPPQFARGPR